MGENCAQQSLRDAAPAKLRNNEHVCEVREYCAIRDDAGKRDLPTARIGSEAQRVSDRALNDFATAALSPV